MAWETAQFGNLAQDGGGDFDGDGAVNRSEFRIREAIRRSADSDYDGRSDAEELMEGTNPARRVDAAQVRLGYFAMRRQRAADGFRGSTEGVGHEYRRPRPQGQRVERAADPVHEVEL